jgi:hypothetical protein
MRTSLVLALALASVASVSAFSPRAVGGRAPLVVAAASKPAFLLASVEIDPTEAAAQTTAAARASAGADAGAWMPVCSVSAFAGLGPTRVEIASRQYVVWSHDGVWSVLPDACPHRLAPLSQGHVDAKTGCLECPYHGW